MSESPAIKVSSRGATTTIRLAGAMDFANVAAVHEAMVKASKKGRSLLVDLSDVDRISTSFVQLLLSAEKSLAEADLSIKLRGPGDEIEAAFCRLGLTEQFEEWRKPA